MADNRRRPSPSEDHGELIDLAVIGRPHGLRGALHVRPFNQDTDMLTVGRVVWLRTCSGTLRRARVVEARKGPSSRILRFEGHEDRDQVRPLVNGRVAVACRDLPALDASEFYLEQIRGMRAIDGEGRTLGTVAGFMTTNIELIVLKDGDAEHFVPVLDGVVVHIDTERRCVTLAPPPGLFD